MKKVWVSPSSFLKGECWERVVL